jgi:hypothetical protein
MIVVMQRLEKHPAEQAAVQLMFVARCWAAGSGPMGCLGGDDMVRDTIIEEMSRTVFSESLFRALGGYII